MTFGTFDEGRAWVGHRSEPRRAWFPIDRSMVLYYCSLVEDANPRYWEGEDCPPGLLMSLGFAPQWVPEYLARADMMFALSVPLPGHHIINASTTTEFERRPRVGDHVSIVEEIDSISEPKTTRVGTGVFITTVSTFSDQHGEVIGRNTNVLFRYDTADSEGAP
ncbi:MULTISPECIES: FAS1-like dehydratase domain-containing protein [Mycobacteriaceae]|nr:MaoC family dehydratase N-terminal domain-containing protein [Mycobacterium intracellulare]MCA2248756.1 MaoC family dehydratase N-terminal domain-containing protein [Mycobacterium intracellulare]